MIRIERQRDDLITKGYCYLDDSHIVERNHRKGSIVPPLSGEQFEGLPDAAKRLLHYSVGQ